MDKTTSLMNLTKNYCQLTLVLMVFISLGFFQSFYAILLWLAVVVVQLFLLDTVLAQRKLAGLVVTLAVYLLFITNMLSVTYEADLKLILAAGLIALSLMVLAVRRAIQSSPSGAGTE